VLVGFEDVVVGASAGVRAEGVSAQLGARVFRLALVDVHAQVFVHRVDPEAGVALTLVADFLLDALVRANSLRLLAILDVCKINNKS